MTEQDDNDTIHLEGRYVGSYKGPDPVTLRCHTVVFREAAFKDTTGAGGDVMRSVVAQPYLDVTGLPDDFVQDKGDWTHLRSPLLPGGESELLNIQPLGGNRARFVVRYRH